MIVSLNKSIGFKRPNTKNKHYFQTFTPITFSNWKTVKTKSKEMNNLNVLNFQE